MPQARNNRKAHVDAALKKVLHRVDPATMVSSLGLDPINKPDSTRLDFDKIDLPRMSSRELSRGLQYATGMLSYALTKGAEIDNKMNAVNTALSSRRSQLYVLYEDKRAKWQIEAEIDADVELKKMQEKYDEFAALRTLIKAHVSVWESRTSMISREMSRRASEVQR